MPQWRKLHVKTLDSVDINEMPDDFTRLLWVLLPLVLDSQGRAIDNNGWLRSKVFPMRQDVTAAQVEQAVSWFAERGMVERYEVDGRRFFQVPTFGKYQGKTDREAASVIPEPVKQSRKKSAEKVMSNSRPTHDQVTTRSSSDVEVDAEVEKKSITNGAGAPARANDATAAKRSEVLAELEKHFSAITHLAVPKRKTDSEKRAAGELWWNPLYGLYELAGHDIGKSRALIARTVTKMRSEKLTISTPKSIEKVAAALFAEDRQANGTYQPATFRE
jgi:hypothetical protein